MFGLIASLLFVERLWGELDIHPETVDTMPVIAAVLRKFRREVAFIKHLQSSELKCLK